LAAHHWNWYCQKADALFSSGWNLDTPFAPRIDIVKRQFIALLDPKAQPCNPCPKDLVLAELLSVTLSNDLALT